MYNYIVFSCHSSERISENSEHMIKIRQIWRNTVVSGLKMTQMYTSVKHRTHKQNTGVT